MSRELFLSWVKQSSVRLHFSSARQRDIVRVMETSTAAAGESVITRSFVLCRVVFGGVMVTDPPCDLFCFGLQVARGFGS